MNDKKVLRACCVCHSVYEGGKWKELNDEEYQVYSERYCLSHGICSNKCASAGFGVERDFLESPTLDLVCNDFEFVGVDVAFKLDEESVGGVHVYERMLGDGFDLWRYVE